MKKWLAALAAVCVLAGCGSTVAGSRRYALQRGAETTGDRAARNGLESTANAAAGGGNDSTVNSATGGATAIRRATTSGVRAASTASATGPLSIGIVRTGVSNA